MIQFFENELASLRESVKEFGESYPLLASELGLSGGRSRDPHVELLLQSFAYMTGRLRRDLSLEKKEISAQILHNLYPSLGNPVPSMTVLEAEVKEDRANFVNGFTLPKGILFEADADREKLDTGREKKPPYKCRMQCCYDTPLWPLRVKDVRLLSTNQQPELQNHPGIEAAIQVEVVNYGMEPVHEYPIRCLRFYLNDAQHQAQLYDYLQQDLVNIQLRAGAQSISLGKDAIRWIGFAEDQNLLPLNAQGHPAHRLMQEYFLFPQKFFFFDLAWRSLEDAHDRFEVVFLFSRASKGLRLHAHSLALNCFPVVNLYPATFAPLQLDYHSHEYRLLAEEQQYDYSEIYSLDRVQFADKDGRSENVLPYLNASTGDGRESLYMARMAPVSSPRVVGHDLYLSFYERNFTLDEVVGKTVVCSGLANNRRLPEFLRVGDALRLVGKGPVDVARVRERPSRYQAAPMDCEALLPLVSQLSLNHIALGDGPQVLGVLRQMLRLYCRTQNTHQLMQIQGVDKMRTEKAVKRLGKESWRGHCRGTNVLITLDENKFAGASILLFGELLSYFFGEFTSLNHFTQLQIRSLQKDEIQKTWPPRIGEEIVL